MTVKANSPQGMSFLSKSLTIKGLRYVITEKENNSSYIKIILR